MAAKATVRWIPAINDRFCTPERSARLRLESYFYQLVKTNFMPLSFWEKDRYFNKVDVTIIGSGIVGLNAALNLKKKAPKLNVLVLERGFLPSGASTKNAGFACFGSVSELIDDLSRHSENEVLTLVERRYKGLKRLRKNLGDAAIDYKPYGGLEVFDDGPSFEKCAAGIPRFNKLLAKVTGVKTIYKVADKKIAQQGLRGFTHLIHNTGEGQIDTGKMMEALLEKVRKLGVIILNGISISSFEGSADGVIIKTDKEFTFTSKRLLIATNGFAKQLLPGYEVEPARAQVLITAPIKGLKLKGAFHYDKGFYYFRNIGKRVLLGGGRNLDLKTEATPHFGLTQIVQEKLEDLLRERILPGVSYTIEKRWSGIMGIGPQKSTILKEVQPHVFCAVRMGGMGVAIGSLVGEDAAALLLRSR
jgi:gamma-glutamylputrescine oxidase